MTLRIRFLLLFVALCAGLLIGLGVLSTYERHESAQILADVGRQRGELLDRLIVLSGNALEQLSLDYSQWTEMVRFVDAAQPNTEWAAVNIDASLGNFGATAAWVLRPDGTVFYSVKPGDRRPPPALPAVDGWLPRLATAKDIHFFFVVGDTTFEVRGAAILPSEDIERTSAPHGFLLVAKPWDRAHLNTLSHLTDSDAALLGPDAPPPTRNPGERGVRLQRPLTDWQGRTVRVLDVYYHSPELERVVDSDRWEAAIFFSYGVLAILIVVLFARAWVLRPLNRISQSLTTGELQPLAGLLAEKSELGRVACLVKSAAEDRAQLRLALDDRARLSRDLHDGIIQTLYASGMSLSSIRALLRRDPAAAESLLDQTRREINASIRDVRNFITRLESEATPSPAFARAVRDLLGFMQAGREVTFDVDVDESLVADLPVDTRAEVLQVVREAVSNALRHGAARHLQVSLRPDAAGRLQLEIVDDGRGFDPAAPPGTGRGLNNLRERAAVLQGVLDIASRPGQGARVTLTFPPPR